MEILFPEKKDIQLRRNYIELREKVLTNIGFILDEKTEDDIEEIENNFFKKFKSQRTWGANGIEAKFIKSYERAAIIISKFTGMDAWKMSVLRFIESSELMKDSIPDKNGKRNGRR